MPTIVGILTFISMINFMFSGVEFEKFYNLEASPGVIKKSCSTADKFHIQLT